MNIKKKKYKDSLLNPKISSIKSSINYDNSLNNYNNIHIKEFNKSINKSFKKKILIKKPLIKKEAMNKILNEDKENKKCNKSLNNNNSFSFIDFNKSKYNNSNSILSSNNKTTTLSNNEKNTLNSIVNKFKGNKSATYLLLNKEKKMKLNSLTNLTNKSLTFLLSDEYNKNKKYKICGKENKDLYEKDNSYLLSTKMVDLFNNKTSDYLDISKNSYRMFSIKKTQFTTDLINCYNKDFNNKTHKEIIRKLKKKYNEGVDIYENQKKLQIQKALKEEKNFYKLKKEEDLKASNYIYKKILFQNRRNDEFRKSIILPRRASLKISNSSLKRFSIGNFNQFLSNSSLLNNLNENNKVINSSNNLLNLNDNLYMSESEKQFYLAHNKYERFKKKKIKQNAAKFRNIIKDLIYSNYCLKHCTYLDRDSKKIRIIYNDLVRLSKIKKISANISSIEIDEFKNDYNKLRKKMDKCENEYYRVITINNKYHLSFLKPILKKSTIKKYLSMKDSNFGIP